MTVREGRTFAEQVGALKRSLHRALVKKLASEAQRPFVQLNALRLIAGGHVHTQSELAERLLIDPPAASRLVAKLADEGLLVRCPGTDRRCVKLEITKAAKKEVELFAEQIAWLEREVKKHVTAKELESAMRVLKQIEAGLEK